MKSARLPTLSAKERIVLDLLVSSGAKYGLQLVDESRGRLKRGTVYVTLGRMEQKGLVESQHEAATRDPDALTRRMYHVTAYGRRVLDAWITVGPHLPNSKAKVEGGKRQCPFAIHFSTQHSALRSF